MTPEQLSQLEAVEAYLAANPQSVSQLDDATFALCKSLLMPSPVFSEVQRGFVQRWFLRVTSDQASELESLWPAGSQYPPREHEEKLLLSIDLLSDALDGGRLSSMLHILITCPLIRVFPEDWPTSPEEPIE